MDTLERIPTRLVRYDVTPIEPPADGERRRMGASEEEAAPVRIGLVGCVKGKGPASAPAADLYVSPLFVGRRRFVEASCDRWFVLSALHGLVDPDQIVAPYDESLVGASVGERRAWADRVLRSIVETLGDLAGTVFELHAGAAYRDYGLVDGLRRRGAAVEVPAAGLSQVRQLAFYADPTDHSGEPARRVVAPTSSRLSGSRPAGYALLSEWLEHHDESVAILTFAELERVLGRSLPGSARKHRAWWGNHAGSPQARAWLRTGWRVAAIDLAGEQVTFERARR